jgi:hypothetical protein
VNLLLNHDFVKRQSPIEQKSRPRSPTLAPVAAALVYPRELAAFLLGERPRLGCAGHGEATQMLEWRVSRPYSGQFIRENFSGSCPTARGFAPRFLPTPSALVELHFTWFVVANLSLSDT